MAQLNVRIPDDLMNRLDAAKPDYLDRKGFLCLLIEQSLDSGFKLGKPSSAQAAEPERGEGFTSKAVSSSSNKDLLTNKSVSMSIPEKLEPYGELIKEFWKIKKGSKGQTAWTRLMGQLTKLLDRYGDTVTRDQLELAINGKWSGVEVSRYEQFLPKGTAPKREKPKELTQEERDARHMEHLKKLGLV